jgi:cobalamin biosynthetic protein CobC
MDGIAAAAHLARLQQHGGGLCSARRLHPNAPEPWIDLSTGINPQPYPAMRITPSERQRLPDPAQLALLEQFAAQAMGVEDPSRVVALPGSELALRLLPALSGASAVSIIGPTYSSHGDAWRRSGVDVREVTDYQSLPHRCAEAVVLVNPNNPDGALFERERCLGLYERVQTHGGSLIVDEAFIELTPRASVSDVAGSARAPQLITLRSFGKFYGLAGLRLGFLIGAAALTARLRSLIGDWPVAADALKAGLAAYSDGEWADRTRARLQHSAQRLDALLTRSGLQLVGGTHLFRLVRLENAADLFQRLLHAGILVRPFTHDATLLRFGLPNGRHSWSRLSQALRVQ